MEIRVMKALGHRGVEEELAEMQGKGEKCRNADSQKIRSTGKRSGNHEIGPRPVYMGASFITRAWEPRRRIAGVYGFLGRLTMESFTSPEVHLRASIRPGSGTFVITMQRSQTRLSSWCSLSFQPRPFASTPKLNSLCAFPFAEARDVFPEWVT